jgi:hypothetical protein
VNAAAEQIELFTVIPLPPCGRNRGPCEAFVETDQLRCVRCGCVAPRTSMRTITDRQRDPFMSIIEGYRRAQLRHLNSCMSRDRGRTAPATRGPKGGPTP